MGVKYQNVDWKIKGTDDLKRKVILELEQVTAVWKTNRWIIHSKTRAMF